MAKQAAFPEIEKMFQKDSGVSRFTSFHESRNLFLEPQFNVQSSFTERMIQLVSLKMFAKIALITGASAGFGVFMGLLMSSFEHNQTMIVDTSRSTRSQLKQHFHGYARFLKRQALHFSKFGLYISLIELPLELVLGKVNSPCIFISGGAAAVLCEPRFGTPAAMMTRFLGSGLFIGGIGLYMHKGNDKS